MRYLIITYDDYFNIPYIQYYENALQNQGQAYDIVLWNRSGQDVDIPNAYVFSAKDRHSKLGKIIPFLRWRNFVLHLLKKNHYDRLIVLTTMPAVLLADQLLGSYRKKFWLDIRDFTYENFPFYKKIVGDLVHAAANVSISSPAFRTFLPDSKNIVLTHNISNQHAAVEHCTLDVGQRPLVIGYVGGIQFTKQNKQLLRQFANNSNYNLKYIGKEHLGCNLPEFCNKNKINNVDFCSIFSNEQKPKIYQDIHIINSIYGCENNVVKLLIPNRLYDCVLFKKPILVSRETHLADVISEFKLGLAVDVEREDVVSALDSYLRKFNVIEFENGCKRFLHTVEKDLKVWQKTLCQFCIDSYTSSVR